MKLSLGIRVDRSNQRYVDAAAVLQDEHGRGLINHTAASILEAVGKFKYENGCFMSDSIFAKNLMGSKKMSMKTIRGYIKYLQYLGLLSIQLEQGQIVRRLAMPDKGPKKTLRDFRQSLGLTAYSYLDKEQDMNTENQERIEDDDDFSSFFLKKSGENFSQDQGKIFPTARENFSTVSNKEEERDNKKIETEKNLHLKNLLHDSVGFEEIETVETEKNKSESAMITHIQKEDVWDFDFCQKDTNMNSSLNSGKAGIIAVAHKPAKPVSDDVVKEISSEPIRVKGKQKKAARTAQERRAEATQAYNAGHLVNPAGKPNTRGRRLKPNQARPVGDTGQVTLSQLWGEYLSIFELNFGSRDLLLGVMSDTRERVEVFFSGIKQKFLDNTGREVDNRVILEYLKWFHDPIRLVPLLRNTKQAFAHPNQLSGLIYIQRFTNEHLGAKTKITTFVSDKVEDEQKRTRFMAAAFEDIRACEKDQHNFAKCIARYGYVVFADYLADLQGMNASQCKTKIVDLMTYYIKQAAARSSEDKESAIEYMKLAWERAIANSEIECYIWPDWKETSKDLLSIVLESIDKESLKNGGSKDSEEGSGR